MSRRGSNRTQRPGPKAAPASPAAAPPREGARRRAWGSPRAAEPPHETSEETLSVAIAARPALFREILARQLAAEPGLRVLGTARDEAQIIELLARVPRVLLFDHESVGPGGMSMLASFRRISPQTRILVLATPQDDETVERMLRAGAAGIVGKRLEFATLVRAIRGVAAGELWANRRAVAQAFEQIAAPAARPWRELGALTKRERQITEGVGRGLRNREIARSLNISEKTVKSHLNNIFRKLKVDNRFAVGLYSLELPSADDRAPS